MSSTPSYSRTIVMGVSGNLMEWYDFAIYGYMVPVIGALFFPSEDPVATIIATFSAFAAGYFARPIGGIIFGHIGDLYGRKAVLLWSVCMMGAATFAIGLLPTYEQVGYSAAVMLVVLRILQGMSVGGEYTGSITFVLEHAKPNQRGLATSWIAVGGTLGFLIGSAVGTLMTVIFTAQELSDWAWRLPFLSGALIAIFGYLMRRDAPEPPRPADIPMEKSPVVIAVRDHWRSMLQVMGLALAVNAGFYMMFVYANTYLTEHMHVSTRSAMEINTINLFILCAVIPLSGWLSDRIGRKPILVTGTLALVFLSWPFFWMMHHATNTMIFLGQLGFAIIIGWVWGANPAALAELSPRHVRVSAFSVAYSVCLALFGGTTPVIAAYLLQRTSDDFAPVWYLIALGVVSLVAVLTIPETRPRPEGLTDPV
jgi:MHS family proline/betaine transporter-like MFS transporter